MRRTLDRKLGRVFLYYLNAVEVAVAMFYSIGRARWISP